MREAALREQYKIADISPQSAASPMPQLEVTSKPASGKKGPTGIGPRTNYSRVNTGTPPVPDAGASAQKSMAPRGAEMLPKLGYRLDEDSMKTSAAARPFTLQDMVKAAQAGAASRVDIAAEAALQQRNLGEEEKTASAQEPTAENYSIPTDQVNKLASALDYIKEQIKEAAHLGGPWTLSEGKVEPGTGPGAIRVMQAESSGSPPGPGQQGAGHHQPPKNPGTEKGLAPERGATKMETNLNNPPGGKGEMLEKNNMARLLKIAKVKEEAFADKVLSAPRPGAKTLTAPNLDRIKNLAKGVAKKASAEKGADFKEKVISAPRPGMKTMVAPTLDKIKNLAKKGSANMSLVDVLLSMRKQAEDAIFPAQISAGAAVPPESNASGQPGGQPAGGAPNGPTGLVGSNQSAIDYKKNQAYANRKADLAKYLTEPALSGQTDKTLAEAFSHTGEAGTKFASAQPAIKTAAARALLLRLAEEASAKANPTPASAQ